MVFDKKQLRGMMVPILFEQFLVMLVGFLDTLIVSYAGEAAVSGVSLTDCFAIIAQSLFLSLATGGAVVVSQYIGHGDEDKASETASQLLMFSALFGLIVTVPVFLFRGSLISLFFGSVERDVYEAAYTYMTITALSFPLISIYNSGASLYRSIGRTGVTLAVSLVSNAINIAGNIIGVFVLRLGVAGVAWPTLIARAFSAVTITILSFRLEGVACRLKWVLGWNSGLLRRIARLAIPAGLESAVFYVVRTAMISFISNFGTVQIAAYGIATNYWNFSSIVSSAAAPVFTTVIGQHMGAGDIDGAERYFWKLLKLTIGLTALVNLFFFATLPLTLNAYAVTEATKKLALAIIFLHNIPHTFLYPFNDPLGKGLRATGDASFVMAGTIVSSVGVRLLFCYILGLRLGWGVMGTTLAMVLDWAFRGSLYAWRLKSGKWKSFKVI